MAEITMTEYTEMQLEINQWFSTIADLKLRIKDAKERYPLIIFNTEDALMSVEQATFDVSRIGLYGGELMFEHKRPLNNVYN